MRLRVLSLPTFGLALAISVLTTYAPALLGAHTRSSAAVGLGIGGEGLFALVLPLLVGPLSDRTRGRLGGRLAYLLAATPLLVGSLALLPLAHGYGTIVGLVSLFYVGYYLYTPPYQALAMESIAPGEEAHAVGVQGIARGLGLAAALVGGGLLLALWTPLPFVLAAAAVLAVTGALVRETRRPAALAAAAVAGPPGPSLYALLRKRADLRAFAVANMLWELSFAGLKTFIVLFVVHGLHRSFAVASAVMGVVAVSYVAAAIGGARLAGRFGVVRLLRFSAWIYGVGLLVAAAFTSLTPLLVGLPVVALAGALLLTLGYALLVQLTPPGAEGAAAGLFGFSRGLGGILGPIVVGASIDLCPGLFRSTGGYGALWIAVGAPILLSLPLLQWLEPAPEPQGLPAALAEPLA